MEPILIAVDGCHRAGTIGLAVLLPIFSSVGRCRGDAHSLAPGRLLHQNVSVVFHQHRESISQT